MTPAANKNLIAIIAKLRIDNAKYKKVNMMGIKFSQLKKHEPLQKVIVHSLDMALYQVSVMINNVEYYVTEDSGEFLRALSPLHVQKRFEKIAYAQMMLRQTSAYDEMCGQPDKTSSNMLEVPYGKNNLY